MILKRSLISIAVLSLLSATASVYADDAGGFEQISIIGSHSNVNDIPGSGAYLTTEDIKEFEYTDIMRALSSVPGVYVMEEDGYGLRPNIGMRGVPLDRSDKITVMEDGVLAAPAAYSAPAAYYFPTFGRMTALEVLKGSSSVMYGPRTTGGVINMVSRQIPDKVLTGSMDLSVGEDGFRKIHGYVGGAKDDLGGLFEVFRYEADGFKKLPVDRDSGFEKNDVMGKFRMSFGEHDHQRVELKVKYSDEESDETYLGLVEQDFNDKPYHRYAASQLDEMLTEHKSYQLNYEYEFSNHSEFNLTAYRNDFHRNWYKASKVGGKSLGSGAEQNAADFDNGLVDSLAVQVKANNRDYLSQGVQVQLITDLDDHHMTFGLRIHEDEMDRFQWVDKYNLNNDKTMTATSAGVPGTDSNRVDSASAVAIYVHDEYTYNDLVVSAGLRYEDMDIERDDWGKALENVGRTNAPATHKENSTKVFIPSVGFTYNLNDSMVLLAGMQKGFAPASPGNADAEEEKGWNYEAGTRFSNGDLRGEVIAFYSDYSNMHGNCTASQSCDEENIGNQYNAGEVQIQGIEFKADYKFSVAKFDMPMSLSYTYSNSKFQNDFESDLGIWGDVLAGFEMPYIPEQQLQFNVGLNDDNWDLSLSGRYLAEMRTVAGQGSITAGNNIPSRTVWDMSAKYKFDDNQKVYLSVDNLFDKAYIATRTHGGIQPGKYRTLQVGYTYTF
ncbi:MAG: Fe(3+) dicitrate transport protein [Phenylobacterium sp.]|jgi:Fe(3+) dicitrate transport protein